MPFKKPITVVVGKPIPVEKTPTPSDEVPACLRLLVLSMEWQRVRSLSSRPACLLVCLSQLVATVHAQYVSELQKLFDTHKAQFGAADATLNVLDAHANRKKHQ
jgi:hypothetical protein